MVPSLLRKTNGKGETPLHVAARHGHGEVVRTLLRYAAAEKNGDVALDMLHETNEDKETALHLAVEYGYEDVAKVLINDDDSMFSYFTNVDGKTPLYMAAERGMWRVVKLIINKYTSPAYEGPNGRTALHAAALCSRNACALDMHVSGVKAIIKKQGLEFLTTKADNDGRTPLHYHPALLLRLGDRSAIFMADKDGNTALQIAAREGDYSGVKEFLKHCPECFESVDKQGCNVLHLAAKSKNGETVRLMLRNAHLNYLVTQKNNDGNTPMDLIATSKISLKGRVFTMDRWNAAVFLSCVGILLMIISHVSRTYAVLGEERAGTVWIIGAMFSLVGPLEHLRSLPRLMAGQ